MSLAVEFDKVSKSYGAVHALQDVSVQVPAGKMHAIVGENGAGKTTLMRVLYGATKPDQGSLTVRGKSTDFHSSADATKAGIGMVSQHYGIIPELTCLQNLVLGAEPSLLLQPSQLGARAQTLAEKMGFEFEWNRLAYGLSPSAKQKLEILKLLWRNSEIMILDEPTAMLSPADGDALFESMTALIEGGATVLLVTHRVREVMQYCERVTVMRAGKVVADLAVSETNESELSRLIVGSSQIAVPTEGATKIAGSSPVLSLKNWTVQSTQGYNALKDVSLDLYPGEILGVAGVDGNGQRELMMSIAGLSAPSNGTISLLDNLDYKSDTRERIEQGLRLIVEDRQSEGAIEEWSLEENTVLGIQFLAPAARGKWVDAVKRHELAEKILERFSTKHGGMTKPMAGLSGGNQQRLVVARSLAIEPRLLIAFQPVRGLDLGASARIYAAIAEACKRGMAALIISFDLDELITHCNRVVVLNHGVMRSPSDELQLDRAAIGDLMVGAS